MLANRPWALAAGILGLLASFWPVAGRAASCGEVDYRGQGYLACDADPAADAIEVFNLDKSGEPFLFFAALASELGESGKRLVFAMNAGMFDDKNRPIGLYVEDGKQARKLNRRNGGGNFHLKPNGVFLVEGKKARVMETEAFAKSGIKPDFASQSGPMLVVDGKIHPKFSENGTSRKIRNGVGELGNGHVVFVVSAEPVTFFEFAQVFLDHYKSRNALFFDGSVSAAFAPDQGRTNNFIPLGPMVGVYDSP